MINTPFDPDRAILDHLHHGVCLFDSDGKVMSANQRFIEIYDYEPSSEKALVDFIREGFAKSGTTSADPQSLVNGLIQAMKEGTTVEKTFEYGDGTIMSIIDRPIGGGRWLSIHEDVTQRVRAEREVAHLLQHDF